MYDFLHFLLVRFQFEKDVKFILGSYLGNVEEERALKMNETTKPAPKRRHPKKSPAGVATRNRKTKRGLIKCRMIKTSEFRVVGFKDRKDDAVFYLKKTK